MIEGLGGLYLPRIEKLKRERRLLIVEGTSDLELLKIWSSTLSVAWPPKLVEWFSTGKPTERKTLFSELAKEVPGLQALSLRDRDDESANSTSGDLTDGNMNDPPAGTGDVSRIVYRKWRRRQIENYLVLPAAISPRGHGQGAAMYRAGCCRFLDQCAFGKHQQYFRSHGLPPSDQRPSRQRTDIRRRKHNRSAVRRDALRHRKGNGSRGNLRGRKNTDSTNSGSVPIARSIRIEG